jgi:phospholipase C
MADPAAQLAERVFVLMLENRSFDHLLGFSGITGKDAVTGQPTAISGLSGSESNLYNGRRFTVTQPADWTMPLDPGHEFTDVLVQLCGPGAVYTPGGPYPPVNNSGFVDNYAGSGGTSNPGEIMKCFGPAQLSNYGDVASDTYRGGQSQHPLDDVRSGETLIKSAYEALRNSPLWDTSLLIVTWDEHGGFYDHLGAVPGGAPSPGDKAVTPGDVNKYGFNFQQYGPRVPAVIVSPRIPQNLIDHRTYDHASIPATAEKIFGIPPLTERDRRVRDVTSLMSLPQPRPTPATLPEPAAAPSVTPVLAQLAGKTGDDGPVDYGSLPGFLHIAQRYDLALSPPAQHPAIMARVAGITTRGQARQYLEDVAAKTAAARSARAH